MTLKQKRDNLEPLQWGMQLAIEMHHLLGVDMLAAMHFAANNADLVEAIYQEDVTPREAIGYVLTAGQSEAPANDAHKVSSQPRSPKNHGKPGFVPPRIRTLTQVKQLKRNEKS